MAIFSEMLCAYCDISEVNVLVHIWYSNHMHWQRQKIKVTAYNFFYRVIEGGLVGSGSSCWAPDPPIEK